MNNATVSAVLNRIAIAEREQRARPVSVSPTVQRILRRWMVGNEEETLGLLCRVADECLLNSNGPQRQSKNGKGSGS